MPKKTIDRWMKTSTRTFLREARGTPGFSWLDLVHGYIYIRWPYLYIGVGTGEHRLAKILGPFFARLWKLVGQSREASEPLGVSNPSLPGHPDGDPASTSFAETYHGKVIPLEPARQLVQVGEAVHLPDLEKVIPYQHARDLILQNPDHIVALDCPCRALRPNPCLPLDVCLIVGEPFASLVQEHHPQRSRWIAPGEAVEILEAEHARGHVHHAFFKDAMLGRFYAICNCCACCCGAMQAHQNGTPMLASSGYIAEVDVALCQACSDCVGFCQFGAMTMGNGHAEVDEAACMGCGVCVDHCPWGATTLRRDPTRGEPLEICALMAAAEAP